MASLRGFGSLLYFAKQDLAFGLGRAIASPIVAVIAQVLFALRVERYAVLMALKASRLSDSRSHLPLLKAHLPEIASFSTKLLPPAQPVSALDSRCVVLAPPLLVDGDVQRKGVLLVSFSDTAGTLYNSVDHRKLASLFHVILEPSSAGYANPDLLCWLNFPEPVLVQSSEVEDRHLLRGLGSNLVPVEYGAGDWVDVSDEEFSALDKTKRFDAICVSNFGWWKRTHAFLKAVAVAKANIPSFHAALVLARFGKTRESVSRLNRLVAWYGLENHLTVMEDLGRQALLGAYAASRVLVFTSWKEGSSRVLFEAMAVDVPVVMLDRNVGVNKDYIVAETGALVPEHRLGDALCAFAREPAVMKTRAWFLRNLGPENTTRKLVRDLHRLFPSENWHLTDVAVKVNAPEARLYDGQPTVLPLSYWLGLSSRNTAVHQDDASGSEQQTRREA